MNNKNTLRASILTFTLISAVMYFTGQMCGSPQSLLHYLINVLSIAFLLTFCLHKYVYKQKEVESESQNPTITY